MKPFAEADNPLAAADRLYVDRQWAAALALYQAFHDTDPGASAQLSVPFIIGHCRIELSEETALEGLALDRAPVTRSDRETIVIKILRARGIELCRSAAFAHAARLMRLLADYDPLIADAYRDDLAAPATLAPTRASNDADPPFLAALGMADLPIDAIKHRHRGTRVLLVVQRHFINQESRRYDPADNLAVSARRFGLTVEEFNSHAPPPGVAPELYGSSLLEAILRFKPNVIVYDNLFEGGMSAASDFLGEQVTMVLELARQQLGSRVVKLYMDAWLVPQERFFKGLGDLVDLVQHMHPTVLGRGSPTEEAAAFCYPMPYRLAPPTIEPGRNPRACFVGSIGWFNLSRLSWWAEAGKRGLPIDFYETLHVGETQRADEAYTNLLCGYQLALNFTRRGGGPKIVTGRSFEVPLAGGVLVEENSTDIAFFMSPGTHYVPFETIDELATVIPALLADPDRRARIRAEGHAWVTRYFTGAYYWAGLLSRLPL